jgi:chromosome segregation ATPase
MNPSWTTFRRRFGRPAAGDAAPREGAEAIAAAAPAKPEPALRPDGSLDTVRQKNELIRVRFANLLDRLEEMRSLKDDFALMTEPVFDLIGAYPQLQSRLLESEAVLRQERDSHAALRRELTDLSAAHARVTDDHAATAAQLRKADARARELEEALDDLRLVLRDREANLADLETQLAIEEDRARTVAEENQALRQEAQESDQAVARAERELIEIRERNGLLDHEVKRLQKVTEEQNYRLSSVTNRHGELETQFEAARQRISELESRLMAEQVARQRADTQIESERSAHQTELSGIEMKMEGLGSRLAATDKILAHTRDQLRDKNEALRGVERVLKETSIEKNTLERRFEATQQEVERQVAIVNELQRSRVELQERVEMLTKAIAAKDFQVESAESKLASLAERSDQLAKRFEQERNALEAANRRLTEELQNEKSERSLLFGALEIARESRIKIQKKYIALRKKTRLDAAEDDDPTLFDVEEAESNVRPLKPSEAE